MIYRFRHSRNYSTNSGHPQYLKKRGKYQKSREKEVCEKGSVSFRTEKTPERTPFFFRIIRKDPGEKAR
ncbi:MAG: hypothetical protein CW338_07725 [Clostridiales bacterium]|nr:hypothetical protein [Clostridiales bacterium]